MTGFVNVLFLQFTFEMSGPQFYRINPELYIFIQAKLAQVISFLRSSL